MGRNLHSRTVRLRLKPVIVGWPHTRAVDYAVTDGEMSLSTERGRESRRGHQVSSTTETGPARGQEDPAAAERHVARAEKHVVEQEELLSKLSLKGADTSLAEELLAEFNATLRLHRTDRDYIASELGR